MLLMKSSVALNSGVFLGALALLCSVASRLHGQPEANDPSLMLYFNFDNDVSHGQVVDLSGHGNHGWQFNPTNWITLTNGVFGSRAAQFTTNFVMSDNSGHVYPASQYIGVTNLNGIEFLTNATISFWVQFDPNSNLAITLLGAGYSPGYTPRPDVVSNSWNIERNFRPNLSFLVFAAGTHGVEVGRWPNDVIKWGGSNPNLGTLSMHLHTITVDCIHDEAITYYDGKPFMTNRVGVPWIRVSGYPIPWLCIGALRHVGTPYWGDDLYPNSGYHQGRLDDIRIYNRVLSSDEVVALYRGAGTPAAVRSLHVGCGAEGVIELTWAGVVGVTYRLELCRRLGDSGWEPLYPMLEATGGLMRVEDRIDNSTEKYYRVYPLP